MGRKDSDTTEQLNNNRLFIIARSISFWASLVAQRVKCLPAMVGDLDSIPGLGRSPGEGNSNSTPVFLPGKSHGQRGLVGYSPWGHEELDTTERLHFHFSLPCTGKGNGDPLQYSCLENPRDRGAWWAVVYGVPQSRTRLK